MNEIGKAVAKIVAALSAKKISARATGGEVSLLDGSFGVIHIFADGESVRANFSRTCKPRVCRIVNEVLS